MSARTVTTQAELDAALANPDTTWIDIHSPAGVWLAIYASGSAIVRAYGSATVHAYGSATVHAYGSATVRASGSATVHAYDSATVHASDSATVHASDSATVRAYDSATVHAYDSATVRASGSAIVRAYGSATVHAYDSAIVRASGSATVHASSRTAVHLHSGHAHITGGVLIDHTDENNATPELWCEIHGVAVTDGWATVYKAVRADLRSKHGFAYPIGETVTCSDWSDDGECGHGLHFSPSPSQALTYDWDATRFLECQVELASLRPLAGGTAKAKAPSARVIREVDEWCRPVPVETGAVS